MWTTLEGIFEEKQATQNRIRSLIEQKQCGNEMPKERITRTSESVIRPGSSMDPNHRSAVDLLRDPQQS